MDEDDYVDQEYIREMIESGDVSVVPKEFSRQIVDYVESLPWQPSGSRLDATRILNSSAIKWSEYSDDEVWLWAKKLLIGRHSHAIMCYAPDSPGLCSNLEFAVKNLDTMIWRAPGTRYLVGADIIDNEIVPFVTDFIECDGRRLLGVFNLESTSASD